MIVITTLDHKHGFLIAIVITEADRCVQIIGELQGTHDVEKWQGGIYP